MFRGLTDRLDHGAAEADELILSVVGANTLGSAWFDAVTQIADPPRWTHCGNKASPASTSSMPTSPVPRRWPPPSGRGFDGWMNGVIRPRRQPVLRDRRDSALTLLLCQDVQE